MISLLLIGHGEVNQGIWQKMPLGTSERGFNV